jgi:hypothetical protein
LLSSFYFTAVFSPFEARTALNIFFNDFGQPITIDGVRRMLRNLSATGDRKERKECLLFLKAIFKELCKDLNRTDGDTDEDTVTRKFRENQLEIVKNVLTALERLDEVEKATGVRVDYAPLYDMVQGEAMRRREVELHENTSPVSSMTRSSGDTSGDGTLNIQHADPTNNVTSTVTVDATTSVPTVPTTSCLIL